MINKIMADVSSLTIGRNVRSARQKLQLTIDDVANLCNVGSRFLHDLEAGKASVHLSKALEVAARLGVRLKFQTDDREPGDLTEIPTEIVSTLDSPPYDSGIWVTSRIAASHAATICGIQVGVSTPQLDGGRLQSIVNFSGVKVELNPNTKTFKDIFELVDKFSAAPVLDIERIIRWALFSLIVGDSTISADRLIFIKDRSDMLRIGPIAVVACASEVIGEGRGEGGVGGLNFAGQIDPKLMRVDHFLTFADIAKVKPKMVFVLAHDLAKKIPGAFDKSFSKINKTPSHRGKTGEIINFIQQRSSRVLDIVTAAKHNKIVGLKKAGK